MTQYHSPKLPPGHGQIHLSTSSPSQNASFTSLSFCYPLKLIVPNRSFDDHLELKLVYLISYGGGMVAGDRIDLQVVVEKGAVLVILTQGSTKIFKLRRGHYPTSTPHPLPIPSSSSQSTSASNATKLIPTTQRMTTTIHPSSTLILLPSPVTCFAESSYSQVQHFDLLDESTSNLILLDWYTSGRSFMDSQSTDGQRTENELGREEWKFDRFSSKNLIRLNGKLVVKDVLLLQNDAKDGESRTSYAERVEPYSIYATLFLFGVKTKPMREYLVRLAEELVQYNQSNPFSLIWSYSKLENGKGGVLRIAGVGTEEVKNWLKQVLGDGGIERIIGRDLWSNVFT